MLSLSHAKRIPLSMLSSIHSAKYLPAYMGPEKVVYQFSWSKAEGSSSSEQLLPSGLPHRLASQQPRRADSVRMRGRYSRRYSRTLPPTHAESSAPAPAGAASSAASKLVAASESGHVAVHSIARLYAPSDDA